MNHPSKKGAHGEHHRSRVNSLLHGRDYTRYAPTINNQIIDGLLEDQEIGLCFKSSANRLSIKLAIRLGSSCSDSRSLTGIQYSEVNPSVISSFRHKATHGINFPDKVTFSYAADGGVARHLAQRFDILCDQKRSRTGTG